MDKTRAQKIRDALAGLLNEGEYVLIVAEDGSYFRQFSRNFRMQYQNGTLTPENTFPVLLAAYGQFQLMVGLLDEAMKGHMATCMPAEFQRMIKEQLEALQRQGRAGILTPRDDPLTTR